MVVFDSEVFVMESGEALRRFRRMENLSQKEVAERLGMLPQAYFRYEKGSYLLPTAALMTLAKEYNVTADYLLGLSDVPRPPDISTLLAALNTCRQVSNDALKDCGAE